jgi:hypothetical protein
MDHVDNITIAVFIDRFIDATKRAKESSGSNWPFMSSVMEEKQQAEKVIDRMNPNVPFCPYRLGGEYPDLSCSYPDILPRGPGGCWAKILSREFLPLL